MKNNHLISILLAFWALQYASNTYAGCAATIKLITPLNRHRIFPASQFILDFSHRVFKNGKRANIKNLQKLGLNIGAKTIYPEEILKGKLSQYQLLYSLPRDIEPGRYHVELISPILKLSEVYLERKLLLDVVEKTKIPIVSPSDVDIDFQVIPKKERSKSIFLKINDLQGKEHVKNASSFVISMGPARNPLLKLGFNANLENVMLVKINFLNNENNEKQSKYQYLSFENTTTQSVLFGYSPYDLCEDIVLLDKNVAYEVTIDIFEHHGKHLISGGPVDFHSTKE